MEWAHDVIAYGWIGLRTTIILSVVSLATSLSTGFFLGLISYANPKIRVLISLYNQLWRGLPVLVTLFAVFFLLPIANIIVDANVAVVIGLTLWGSANVAEIVFGAMRALPPSQTQAGRSLGFGTVGLLTHVLLPQAIRRMGPSLVNILANLIQATSLASAVGAVDMLEAVKRASVNLTFMYGDAHSFVVYGVVMIVYFLLCFPLSLLAKRMDRTEA